MIPLTRHQFEILLGREMRRNVQKVESSSAECGKVIDWESYCLGRFQSETRTEYKKSVYQ